MAKAKAEMRIRKESEDWCEHAIRGADLFENYIFNKLFEEFVGGSKGADRS